MSSLGSLGSLGSMAIGAEFFPIRKVELCGGQVRVTAVIPPGPLLTGHVTVYGADGFMVSTGKTVIVPPHDFHVEYTYGLGITSIESAGEVQDLSKLPGWGIVQQ